MSPENVRSIARELGWRSLRIDEAGRVTGCLNGSPPAVVQPFELSTQRDELCIMLDAMPLDRRYVWLVLLDEVTQRSAPGKDFARRFVEATNDDWSEAYLRTYLRWKE